MALSGRRCAPMSDGRLQRAWLPRDPPVELQVAFLRANFIASHSLEGQGYVCSVLGPEHHRDKSRLDRTGSVEVVIDEVAFPEDTVPLSRFLSHLNTAIVSLGAD